MLHFSKGKGYMQSRCEFDSFKFLLEKAKQKKLRSILEPTAEAITI